VESPLAPLMLLCHIDKFTDDTAGFFNRVSEATQRAD